MKKHITALLIATLLAPVSVLSQSKELEKLISNDKQYGKAWHAMPGSNQIRNWQIKKGLCTEDDYQMPKRIGILSFYVQDKAKVTSSSYSNTITASWATPDGVNFIADMIHNEAIARMKADAAEMGVELLQPYEFLTDPELIELYNTYQFESGKFMDKFNEMFAQSSGYSATAYGYRNFPMHHIGVQDMKFAKSRDAFYEKLGVEAIMIVSIDVSAAAHTFNGVSITVNTHNPASGKETTYLPFNEGVSINFKPEGYMHEAFVLEEKEYQDKKGKTKTRDEIVGVDPNVAKVVADGSIGAIRLVDTWIKSKKE